MTRIAFIEQSMVHLFNYVILVKPGRLLVRLRVDGGLWKWRQFVWEMDSLCLLEEDRDGFPERIVRTGTRRMARSSGGAGLGRGDTICTREPSVCRGRKV